MNQLKKTLCALLLAFTGCGERERTLQQPQKPSFQYLTVETKENLTYKLSLECLEDRVNMFITPRKRPKLHFYEEEIAPQEYFVATDAYGNTRIVEYSALQSNEIWFWDMSSFETTRVPYPADTVLTLGDSPRTFYILPNGNILVDQNGNGKIDGFQSPIVYKDGRVLLEEDLRR